MGDHCIFLTRCWCRRHLLSFAAAVVAAGAFQAIRIITAATVKGVPSKASIALSQHILCYMFGGQKSTAEKNERGAFG